MDAALKPKYEDQLVRIHNERLWWMFLGQSGIAILLLVILGVVVSRPTPAPYIIEVDHGIPIGHIEPLRGTAQLTDAILRWEVGEYIKMAFGIEPSFDLEKANLERVYSMSAKPAADKLTAFYHGDKTNSPLQQRVWQNVTMDPPLAMSPGWYQVRFLITRHENDDQTVTHTYWQATIQAAQMKPTDANPLGFIVQSLDFSQEQP